MYTIKEAAVRTGLSPSVIRAWERRYGVVQPLRSQSGYRLYDDVAIGRLLAMRRLVETGWLPSEAARALSDGRVEPLLPAPVEPVGAELRHPGAERRAGSVSADERAATIERFVEAAAAHDDEGMEAVLDEIGARGRFEAIVDELLLPAAAALGDAWARGRLDSGAEHAASAAVLRRLATAFQAAGDPRTGPPLLVGLPPASRHELGALAFAVAARRRGLAVHYLGADVPISSWIEALERTAAWLAVVGVVTPDDRGPAIEVARALRRPGHDVLVAFGGAAAPEPPPNATGLWLRLPGRVVDAAALVQDLWRTRFGTGPSSDGR